MSNQTAMAQRGLMPITVQNITLTLNERMLIDDLSCIIKSDGMSVIMGPNGAGKSLFMRCLHGLAKPDMGQILYADMPLEPCDHGNSNHWSFKPRPSCAGRFWQICCLWRANAALMIRKYQWIIWRNYSLIILPSIRRGFYLAAKSNGLPWRGH
jgi:energy-coupling factor transporter ATP-binding protein EcfA2